jgi:hypothetical protein
MGGNNPKPSTAVLQDLKDALSDLQAVQSTWTQGKYSQTLDKIGSITDLSSDHITDLLNGAGTAYNTYYGSRADAVSKSVASAKQGIGTLVSLLQATISNYDTNEQNNAGAADNTGASSNGSSPDGKG